MREWNSSAAHFSANVAAIPSGHGRLGKERPFLVPPCIPGYSCQMKTILLAAIALLAVLLPVHAQGRMSAQILEGKVQNIILDEVVMRGFTMQEAIELLTQRSKNLDSDPDASLRGVTFIVVPPAGPDRSPDHNDLRAQKVDYTGKNVSLDTVLREIAKITQHDVFLTSAGVVIVPKGNPPFPNEKADRGEIYRKLTRDGE